MRGQKAAGVLGGDALRGGGDPEPKPASSQSRANRRAQAAQEFYHLKTTPGRFLLLSPTVYQTHGQASPAWPARHRRVRSPPVHGAGLGDRFLSAPLQDATSTWLKHGCPAAKASPSASCSRRALPHFPKLDNFQASGYRGSINTRCPTLRISPKLGTYCWQQPERGKTHLEPRTQFWDPGSQCPKLHSAQHLPAAAA